MLSHFLNTTILQAYLIITYTVTSSKIVYEFFLLFSERVQNTTRSRLEDINIGGLIPARVYFFRVVAYNSAGSSSSSKSLRVITQSEEHVPSTPMDVTAFPTSTRSIHVEWRPPQTTNGEILRYNVYYMEVDTHTF